LTFFCHYFLSAFFLYNRETKTVNAWFQNKRASSKKRSRVVPHDTSTNPSSSTTPSHSSSSDTARPLSKSALEAPRYSEERQAPRHPVPLDYLPLSPIYRDRPNSDHNQFSSDTEASNPRRLRLRPASQQEEELRKLYDLNPHSTADQRQILAERIEMYGFTPCRILLSPFINFPFLFTSGLIKTSQTVSRTSVATQERRRTTTKIALSSQTAQRHCQVITFQMRLAHTQPSLLRPITPHLA
jgi:hypothetical protein